MSIRFLNRDQIDNLKWDQCIDHAKNGNTYGFSWFLDSACNAWGGLVEGDYKAVFPLVSNRKLFGISQLYQPYFCQQLGIYSPSALTEVRIKKFLQAIPSKYKYIEINLNERSPVVSGELGFSVVEQLNCLLSLEQPYEDICRNYSQSLRRCLKKARASELSLTESLSPETLVKLYRTYQGPKISAANGTVYGMALKLMHEALARKCGFLSGVKDSSGKLVAGAFFLSSHDRIINLIPSATVEGRKLHAMHFLYDSLIREKAESPTIFDFEGSSVPSITRFFKSFGSEEVPFYQIKRNDLPFWIKWRRS